MEMKLYHPEIYSMLEAIDEPSVSAKEIQKLTNKDIVLNRVRHLVLHGGLEDIK